MSKSFGGHWAVVGHAWEMGYMGKIERIANKGIRSIGEVSRV